MLKRVSAYDIYEFLVGFEIRNFKNSESTADGNKKFDSEMR